MAEVRPVPFIAPGVHRCDDLRSVDGIALRAASATTTSYVASSYANVSAYKNINLEFVLSWVDSTSTEWYVEWSSDATVWQRSANYAVSAGTITATLNSATIANSASANWIDGPIEVQDVYVRVNVKKTGGAGADTLKVTLVGLTL